MKLSIIGRAGHASRYITLASTLEDVSLDVVYHPKPMPDTNPQQTDDFERLLESDAIVIASPTPTHAGYLDRLAGYRGYVLVEKPAVSTREETTVLRQWVDERKQRVRVNYNFEYSALANLVRDLLTRPDLGSAIFLNIYASIGLAFTPRYETSWRQDVTQSYGVFELVGVHFIHFASTIFGKVVMSRTSQLSVAGHGNAPPDTVICSLSMASGAIVTLFLSYGAPRMNRVTLMGTNGYWDYDGFVGTLRYPRDSFGTSGLFVQPPPQHVVDMAWDRMWAASFDDSVKAFVDVVKSRGRFDTGAVDRALDAMEPVFAARDGRERGGRAVEAAVPRRSS
jgi:predicted dehydrogenase